MKWPGRLEAARGPETGMRLWTRFSSKEGFLWKYGEDARRLVSVASCDITTDLSLTVVILERGNDECVYFYSRNRTLGLVQLVACESDMFLLGRAISDNQTGRSGCVAG